jgi:outer membrane immunogenic protein
MMSYNFTGFLRGTIVKALLSTLAMGVLVSGSAFAAELGLPVVTPPLPVAFDWSGVYVGGHIGAGWERTTFIDPGATSILGNAGVGVAGGAVATDARPNSLLGGAQIGWMYQIGRLVVGSELDWSWTRLNSNGAAFFGPALTTAGPPLVTSFANEVYRVSTKWTGTATTMIGLARDHWMFYSKAGAAWAPHDYALAVNGSGAGFVAVTGSGAGVFFRPTPVPFGFAPPNTSDTLVGWTVGTGVKWAVSNNWFINAEYDYMDFGSKGQNFSAVCTAPVSVAAGFGPCTGGTAAAASTFNPTFNHRISEVKVGLNYKFEPGFLLW